MNKTFYINKVNISYGDADFSFFNIHKTKPKDNAITERSPMHSHRYYEIHFIISGKTRFMLESGELSVSEGYFVIFPPSLEHLTVISDDLNDTVIAFTLSRTEGEKGFFRYFKELFENASPKVVKAEKELLSYVSDFSRMDLSSAHSFIWTKGVLCNIVTLICKALGGFSEKHEFRLAAKSQDFPALLDNYITDAELSVNDIAKFTGYSTRSISRIVRSVYGESISEIRRKHAFSTAKKIIAEDKLSLDEVAKISGFKSRAAMNSAFLKYMGITPKQYRENVNNDSEQNKKFYFKKQI